MIQAIPPRTPREYLERLQAQGEAFIPVRMSIELLLQLVDGVSFVKCLHLAEIGEPDRDGFFTPLFCDGDGES